MAEVHPQNMDQRPKRRRDKDNPYEIFTVGVNTDRPHYYIRFMDSLCVEHCMEIEKELFDLFDQFELEDLSFFNEVDRHYDLSEQNEETLSSHALDKPYSVEEVLLQRLDHEQLRKAIAVLPGVQRKRLVLYYFGGFTYEEIAGFEKCSVHSVYVAIERAKEKIKKFLESGVKNSV